MSHFLEIVIPTYNRVKKLQRLLDSIRKQTYKNYCITVVADNNCQKTKNAYEQGMLGVVNFIVNDKQMMPIRIWNRYLAQSVCANLVYLCDDVELYEDCLEKGVAYLNSTDRLVGFKQIIKDSTDSCEAAMGIIGSRFADRFPNRQVFCPEYFNMCVDAELLEYAKKHKVFTFASDAKLTHYHPGYYKSEIDGTHSITRSDFANDRKIRADRKKAGLLWGENG